MKNLNYFRINIGKHTRKLRNYFDNKKWKKYNNASNYYPTIISQNYTGGVMSHDLGLQFTSPTINSFKIPLTL